MTFVLYWLSDFNRPDSMPYRCRALSDYLDRPIDAAMFDKDVHGKPVLRSGECKFNISHSGDFYFLTIHPDASVGIDYEQVKPSCNISRLVKRVLSKKEQRVYLELPDSKRMQYFFDTWQQKEALGKAQGCGLQLGFSTINICDYAYPKSHDGWSVRAYSLSADVTIYLAAESQFISEKIEIKPLTHL